MSFHRKRIAKARHWVIGLLLSTVMGCGVAQSGAIPPIAPEEDASSTEPMAHPTVAPSMEPPAQPTPEPAPSHAPFATPEPPQPTMTPTPTPSITIDDRSTGEIGGSVRAQSVQPYFIQPGEQATFQVQADTRVTAAISATSFNPSSPSFLLSLAPTQQAYTLQQYFTLPSRATSSKPSLEWPFKPTRPLTTLPQGQRRIQQQSATAERTLGSEEGFWIFSSDSEEDAPTRRMTVLRRMSEHAYYYVDVSAAEFSEANFDALVSTFENQIYPRLSNVFGPVATPGVDGDRRIFVVFSPAVHGFGANRSLLGYFSAHDAVPAELASPFSNQKEVLFMSDMLFEADPILRYGVLAHELQHLINFSQKGARLGYQAKETLWLDEGLSMYAMEVAGFGIKGGATTTALDIKHFQENPTAYSLTDWHNNPNGYSYGQSYLFVRYLVDRYGESIVPEILNSSKVGLVGLNELLMQRQDNLVNFFRAWTIANLISGTPIAEGTPYNYASLDVRGTYGGIQLPGITPIPVAAQTLTEPLRPWGSAYYTWNAPQPNSSWFYHLNTPADTPLTGSLIVQ